MECMSLAIRKFEGQSAFAFTDVVKVITFFARAVIASAPVDSYAPAGGCFSPMSLPSTSMTFATSNP